MSDWRCRFGWHPWGKWLDPEEWELTNVWTKACRTVYRQSRTCPSCGKHQVREEG